MRRGVNEHSFKGESEVVQESGSFLILVLEGAVGWTSKGLRTEKIVEETFRVAECCSYQLQETDCFI